MCITYHKTRTYKKPVSPPDMYSHVGY